MRIAMRLQERSERAYDEKENERLVFFVDVNAPENKEWSLHTPQSTVFDIVITNPRAWGWRIGGLYYFDIHPEEEG